MSSGNEDRAARFWTAALMGVDAPTPLMIDSIATNRSGSRYESVDYAGTHCSKSDDPNFWCSAFALLLGRYSNEDMVLFGVANDGAVRPVVAWMDWEQPFSKWSGKLESWQREAMTLDAPDIEYLRRSFTDIPDGTGLFDALLVPPGESAPDFPVALMATVTSDGLRLRFDSDRLTKSAIDRLARHFDTLAGSLVEQPDTALIDVRLLPEDEYETVVHGWNATEVDFPDDKCLHELFEEQVTRQPDAIAATWSGESLSYRELNERANRIAHRLIQLGARSDAPVGISLRRSTDMVAAMLAISKSGAGYLPLDPEYPVDRLQFMVEDADLDILITESELVPIFAESSAEKLVLDEDENLSTMSSDNPSTGVAPEHLAYLIYTSGSTGRPKGVMVDHRGRVNNFCDFNRRYSVGPGDRLLGLSSISFDMCAYDVFGTLAAGAEIVVGPSGGDVDPNAWADLMTRHEVTVWHSVPALLEMVVDEVESKPERHPRSLRLVLLGGDWIPVTLPDRVKAISAQEVRVISMGGATEVSMDSTIYEIEETDADWKSIPYGAPMWNQRAYVLDRRMRPVAIGVPGELFLGGIGVGRGYHNRPELSAEKFVDNPFVPGERMYRTGDLCRWREDGNLQILGRMDFQVKIRGFRIELGEIEAALRSHPDVREAVVMANDGPSGDRRLAAYIVREDSEFDAAAHDEKTSRTVDKWAAVFDAAYQAPGVGDADPTFKITSWDSSYTGEPYGAEEVREWVNTSVDRILDLNPKRVFEIGCGTGLLLFRIAPQCQTYIGIDTSAVAVDHVATHCERLGIDNVQVAIADAAHCDDYEAGSFDTVVINSVAQNFPNAEYFLEVIRNAIRLLKPGGAIFLGDMRDMCAERELQTSISLARAPDSWTGDEVLSHAERQIDRQEELIADPAVFTALCQQFPEISHAEVELRRGSGSDEMTRFRFNAMLFVGDQPTLPDVDMSVEWDGRSLAETLQSLDGDIVEISNIPNARIRPEADILAAIEGDSRNDTSEDLRDRLQELRKDPSLVSPYDFENQAREAGFECVCRYARSGDRGQFDALLIRGDQRPRCLPFEQVSQSKELADFFNVPLDEAHKTGLTPELRRHVEATLPHYMVPASYIYLDRFPLSPNGKVNRRALPEPDNVRPELETEYVAPTDELESVLARIWTDGLGLDRVGMLDPFVAVGGSSLLATQLVSRVRDIFQVQLPMRQCLNGHLRDVKASLLKSGSERSIDMQGIAETYLQILSMSESEVQERLQESSQ